MLISPQHFEQLKAFLKLENLYNIFVLTVTGLIVLLSCVALSRPVASQQYQYVSTLSQQATYPKTQQMALDLLRADEIRRLYYFKLLRAYQFEQAQVRHYPALFAEDAD